MIFLCARESIDGRDKSVEMTYKIFEWVVNVEMYKYDRSSPKGMEV